MYDFSSWRKTDGPVERRRTIARCVTFNCDIKLHTSRTDDENDDGQITVDACGMHEVVGTTHFLYPLFRIVRVIGRSESV